MSLPSNQSLILALDIGSSSARAVLYDRQGNVDNLVQQQYDMDLRAAGGAEIAAPRLVEITAAVIDGALSALGGRAVGGVAVSTFWHSLVGISADGAPTTPVIGWSDTRAHASAQSLRAQVNEKELHERTGARLHASYWPAKLHWLNQSHPDLVGATARWLSFGDYLFLTLFGEVATSLSMASGTGLFNQRECQWDQSLLALLSLPAESLPPLRDFNEPMQGLRPAYAQRWPALAHIPWFLPIGDGAGSNIGNGCLSRERFVLMIGTSGAIRAVSETVSGGIPPALWCYRVDRRRLVQGGALSNGGNLFAWMRENLRLPAGEELEAALARLAPDSHGLTMLPMFSGERSPGWHDEATAAIDGLRLSTTPVEILRAGLEAVAYQFATVYEALVARLGEPAVVVATGGALKRSRVWRQILADVLGKEVALSAVAEASSRGVALLAMEALGWVGSELMTALPITERITPMAAHHESYRQARARTHLLYRVLIEGEG